MKFRIFIFIAIFFQTLNLNQVKAITVSDNSKILASCETVYLYNSHLALMKNNEGLAKSMLYRGALAVAANMMLNEINGNVSGEILGVWRRVGLNMKSRLDKKQTTVSRELMLCDEPVERIIREVIYLDKTLWGYDFDELHQLFYDKLRLKLGI